MTSTEESTPDESRPTGTATFSVYTGPESEERVSSKRRSIMLQKIAIADPADQRTHDSIYYFGTGPIVNPLVRKRRGVEVSDARAAVLPEYRITFAVGGLANVVPGAGCEVHGVVMKFDTEESWEKYRKQNAGNDTVKPVDVYAYDDGETPIRAYVFVMEGKEIDQDAPMEQPAEERYLKLIADGLRSHGVDDDFIEFTIMNTEYVPSRKPSDYFKFPSKSKIPTITYKKYEKLCREAKDKCYFIIGDAVFDMNVSNPENPGAKYVLGQWHGKGDISWTMYMIRIDPDIPEVDSREDFTPQHIEWVESMTYEYLSKCNLSATKCYQLVDDEKHSDGGLFAFICCQRGKQ